jgi:hypothetical protein
MAWRPAPRLCLTSARLTSQRVPPVQRRHVHATATQLRVKIAVCVAAPRQGCSFASAPQNRRDLPCRSTHSSGLAPASLAWPGQSSPAQSLLMQLASAAGSASNKERWILQLIFGVWGRRRVQQFFRRVDPNHPPLRFGLGWFAGLSGLQPICEQPYQVLNPNIPYTCHAH